MPSPERVYEGRRRHDVGGAGGAGGAGNATMAAMRPVLFLDVDGPLIPFGATPAHYPDGRQEPNPLLARLNPEHGRRLANLPCDLVWATTWMAEANDVIAPRLGLPDLPVVDWPDGEQARPRLHWKTCGLVGFAAGRPFIWVDDEITDADRIWVASHHRGEALLHRVDPRAGLTDADFADIERWLAQR